MQIRMISLHEPTFDESDERLLLEALRSTWVSTGGPLVERFEREFASYVGSKHAVSVANGTVAIQLMLEVLAKTRGVVGPFDVLIPSMTFIATGNAVVHAGGNPVLVDCAPNSLNIDPKAVAACVLGLYEHKLGVWIAKKTGHPLLAVMPAHIMGYSCDMSELASLCAEYNVPVVDDAAEALGAFFHGGQHVGTQSLAAAFSFNGNKILTTGGGGMIVTNDDAFAKRAKHLSTTAKIDGLRFVHDEVGHNYRMVNLLAALGCSQMAKLPARIERKKEIASLYRAEFAGTSVSVYAEAHCESNFWLVNAVFRSETAREQALSALMAADIQARPLWTPLHRQPAYEKYRDQRSFAHAEHAWRHMLSLPSSPSLDDSTVRRIAKIVVTAASAS